MNASATVREGSPGPARPESSSAASSAPTTSLVRAAAWPAAPLPPGAGIGGTRYVVCRFVARGGMGEVYEVEHRELGRTMVLKVLRADQAHRADLVARLRWEARALASVRHPNVVQVFDLGALEDGRPFFVMERLRGRDLRAELARLGVLAVPVALALVGQALEGLGAAHARGVVHRDVKLENLVLCDDGTLKILDFGIARIPGAKPSAPSRAGTPRSMAPEQHEGGATDPRTDLYAAGLVLYELLCGRGPFDDACGSGAALSFAHAHRAPPAPSLVAPQQIPEPVDAAVLRALAKAPAERFQSAREMADMLAWLRGERRRKRGLPPPRATNE